MTKEDRSHMVSIERTFKGPFGDITLKMKPITYPMSLCVREDWGDGLWHRYEVYEDGTRVELPWPDDEEDDKE